MTIYKVKYRLSGTKGRLDTADDKMCETEDRVTETIQSERAKRQLGKQKDLREALPMCNQTPWKVTEDGERDAVFPNLTPIKHTIQKVQQGRAQEA